MSMQTDAPLTRLAAESSSRSTRELARFFVDVGLQLDPPYQRGSVWTVDMRRLLIRSLLLGLPVPAIILNDRLRGGWDSAYGSSGEVLAVVDGKQRMETLIAWYDGTLAVPASWFPDDQVESTVDTDDGPYVTYDRLSRSARTNFATTATIPVITLGLPDEKSEADAYLLVNGSGVAQSEDDMDRARQVAGA